MIGRSDDHSERSASLGSNIELGMPFFARSVESEGWFVAAESDFPALLASLCLRSSPPNPLIRFDALVS